jgi:hypothetical protein
MSQLLGLAVRIRFHPQLLMHLHCCEQRDARRIEFLPRPNERNAFECVATCRQHAFPECHRRDHLRFAIARENWFASVRVQALHLHP